MSRALTVGLIILLILVGVQPAQAQSESYTPSFYAPHAWVKGETTPFFVWTDPNADPYVYYWLTDHYGGSPPGTPKSSYVTPGSWTQVNFVPPETMTGGCIAGWGEYYNFDTYSTSEGCGSASRGMTIYASSSGTAPTFAGAPSGPAELETGQTGAYTVQATDAEGHQSEYIVNWGDGAIQVRDYAPSGTPTTLTHAYQAEGSYCVKFMAIDEKGSHRWWSPCRSVTVTDPPQPTDPIYDELEDLPTGEVDEILDWVGDLGPEDLLGLVPPVPEVGLVPLAPIPPVGPLSTSTGRSETYTTSSAPFPSLSMNMAAPGSFVPVIGLVLDLPLEDPALPENLIPGLAPLPDVRYRFDWDDGYTSLSPWATLGEPVSMSHSWRYTGSYCVTAVAIDESGAQSASSGCLTNVGVTGNNPPDKASTPSGPSKGEPRTSYSYSTSATDRDGDTLRYTVNWGDGTTSSSPFARPSGSTEALSHTWSNKGDYCISARAHDGQAYGPWSDCRWVELNGAPEVPEMTADTWEGDSTSTYYGFQVRTTDADGDYVRYEIDWGDGSPDTITSYGTQGQWRSVSHRFDTRDSFCITVRARDDDGAYSDWSECYTFTIPNAPPTTPTISGPSVGLQRNTEYTFGFKSSDPDGETIRYRTYWGDQGDFDQPESIGSAPSGSTVHADHAWSVPGTKCIESAASDPSGGDSGWSDCFEVEVVNQPPEQPELTVEGDEPTQTHSEYTFHAVASDADDPYWQISYFFDWGDGNVERVNDGDILTGEPGVTATHEWSSPGQWCVKVRAQDGYDSGPWSDCLDIDLAGPPTACASVEIQGMTANVDASCSGGSSSGVEFIMDWGDGSTSIHSNPQFSHVYGSRGWGAATSDHIGAYSISMTMQNAAGEDSTDLGAFDVGPSDLDLAWHWAPVFYHDTAYQDDYSERLLCPSCDSDLRVEYDEFVTVNFDGDWNTQNNWGAAKNHQMPSAAYYNVHETTDQYLIGYTVFHPRDIGTFRSSTDPGEHANDVETVLLSIQKDAASGTQTPQGMGRFISALTMAHNTYNVYWDQDPSTTGARGNSCDSAAVVTAPNPALAGRTYQEAGDTLYTDSGDVDFFCGDGGQQILLDIEHGGHGIYGHGWHSPVCPYWTVGDNCWVWDEESGDFRGGDGNILYPTKGVGEVPGQNVGGPRGDDRVVLYNLRPLTTVWNHRYDVNVIEPQNHPNGPFYSWGTLYGTQGTPFTGNHHANMPWSIFNKLDSDRPEETWFEHPLRVMTRYFPSTAGADYVYRSTGGVAESWHAWDDDFEDDGDGYPETQVEWTWHRPGATQGRMLLTMAAFDSGDDLEVFSPDNPVAIDRVDSGGYTDWVAGDRITFRTAPDLDGQTDIGWFIDRIEWQ